MPLEFDEVDHIYRLDGRVLPSVTEILKDVGAIDTQWYTEGDRHRGSLVHRAALYLMEGDLDWSELDESIAGYVRSLDRFLAENRVEVLFAEKIVHGPNHAGRLDIVCKLSGRLALIDEKTGNVEPACKLQTAGYAQALEYSEGIRAERRYGLKLHADGKAARIVGPYDDVSDFAYWNACVRVYYGKRNRWSEIKPLVQPDEAIVDPEAGERIHLDAAIKAALKKTRNPVEARARHFRTPRWNEIRLKPLDDLRRGLESLRAAVEVKA